MNLQLSLKRKWFNMTKAGIKAEDYREINVYWSKRLVYNLSDALLFRSGHCLGFVDDADAYSFITNRRSIFGFKEFDTNIMTDGYPKSGDPERTLILEHAGIEIRTGNPEWGAEPDKLYFVVKHGNIIK